MPLSFNPVKVKSSKPKHLQMSEMSMAKYDLSLVGSDVDLDGLDATLPWLSGFTNEATTNETKVLHKTKRFLCEDCGKLYYSSACFKRHTYAHLTSEKNHWQCHFCSKYFKLYKHLETHWKNYYGSCRHVDCVLQYGQMHGNNWQGHQHHRNDYNYIIHKANLNNFFKKPNK